MTDVISIQSQVVHGHVGNSAAVFPLQASGLEVAAVPTVLLSNHPRYPSVHGHPLDSGLIASLLRGVEERGLVESARVILTGYLGSVEIGRVVADFVRRARTRNLQLTYVCDPVMGDEDLGLFVEPELIGHFRDELVPLASVITPNQYELELLSGAAVRSIDTIREALQRLSRRGTRAAAVTGCVLDDTPSGALETIAWEDGKISRTAIERVPIRPCGTGDLFTALLVARLCAGDDIHAASALATRDILAVLNRTHAAGADEMRIVGFPFKRAITEDLKRPTRKR